MYSLDAGQDKFGQDHHLFNSLSVQGPPCLAVLARKWNSVTACLIPSSPNN